MDNTWKKIVPGLNEATSPTFVRRDCKQQGNSDYPASRWRFETCVSRIRVRNIYPVTK